MCDYNSLEELQTIELENKDWSKTICNRNSWLLIVAPHAGTIEPHTDVIAEQIAASEYSLFIFRGLRQRTDGRKWLHVTSSRFHDNDLKRLQAKASVSLAIHGASDSHNDILKITHLGGLNKDLRDSIAVELTSSGFKTIDGSGHLAGTSDLNLVNRTPLKGVQLEISRSQRCELSKDADKQLKYTAAIIRAIFKFKTNQPTLKNDR